MSTLIIDDSNFEQFQGDGESRVCGTLPRRVAYGQLPCAATGQIKTIPMEQWPDLIADLERQRATLFHIWKDTPMGVLMQSNLSYCHAFSAVGGVMIQRAIQNLPFKMLSASSVGAPVTGYRNAGAVIEDDLQQMVDVGVCTTDFVPMLTTRKGDFKAGWEANAAENKVTEFDELAPRNFLEHGSALLANKPVCVALNYWGHAVLDLVLKDLNPRLAATNVERYGPLFLNSWDKTWGDGGFAVRAGSKKYADQAYVPRQIKAAA